MKRADSTTKKVETYDDLEPGTYYPKTWLNRLTLPRGRYLSEALLNDPMAPEPVLDNRATLFSTEQIMEYVTAYDALVEAEAAAAIAIARAQRDAGRVREKARLELERAKTARIGAVERMRKDAKKWSMDAARQAVLDALGGLTKEVHSARVSGIYFLMQDDAVVYVGQSVNVYARVATHAAGKAFNRVRFLPCAREDMNDWEGFLIRLLDPPLNGKNQTGAHSAPASRIWDMMVARDLPREFVDTCIEGVIRS